MIDLAACSASTNLSVLSANTTDAHTHPPQTHPPLHKHPPPPPPSWLQHQTSSSVLLSLSPTSSCCHSWLDVTASSSVSVTGFTLRGISLLRPTHSFWWKIHFAQSWVTQQITKPNNGHRLDSFQPYYLSLCRHVLFLQPSHFMVEVQSEHKCNCAVLPVCHNTSYYHICATACDSPIWALLWEDRQGQSTLDYHVIIKAIKAD